MVLIIIAAFCRQYRKAGIRIAPDTSGYIHAAGNLAGIFCGDVDTLRTPVYPAYLALCRFLFGENHYLTASVFLQFGIFLLAVCLFYRLVCRLLPNTSKSIIWTVIVLFYFVYDFRGTVWWNRSVLTESLSISAVIFFFFLLVSYSQNPSYLKAILLGTGLLVLIMLRPVFVFFLPVTMFFFIGQTLFFRKHWKQDITGLAAATLTFTAV